MLLLRSNPLEYKGEREQVAQLGARINWNPHEFPGTGGPPRVTGGVLGRGRPARAGPLKLEQVTYPAPPARSPHPMPSESNSQRSSGTNPVGSNGASSPNGASTTLPVARRPPSIRTADVPSGRR